MDKLQVQDSGVYWCALYNPYRRPAFTRIMEVRLSVDKSEYLLADFGLTSLAQSPFSPMPQQEGAQHCACTVPTHVSLHVCLVDTVVAALEHCEAKAIAFHAAWRLSEAPAVWAISTILPAELT
ncbi:hypothetical protein CIB84_016867 [Bambusicola thoracicus]|uniref:Immunoglobulin V-set domain-containing protein n=1 Tax=Bambusicola thoracicus TaxID=9083 RepID=A0A2P4S5H9_BAMTH|nr:hypothetical protein CIB84_016867 [Bambusicola thoracicus]